MKQDFSTIIYHLTWSETFEYIKDHDFFSTFVVGTTYGFFLNNHLHEVRRNFF